jgi:hypothetical protein
MAIARSKASPLGHRGRPERLDQTPPGVGRSLQAGLDLLSGFDNRASGAQNRLMPLVVRLPLIIVSVAAYFGLAILGRGGFAAFFSEPALIGLTVVLFAMSFAAAFAGGNLSPGVREDRSKPLGDWCVWVNRSAVGVSAGVAGPQRVVDPRGDMVRWLGVVLFAAGGALRIWPVFVLDRRFSGLVAIQPGHTLRRAGSIE